MSKNLRHSRQYSRYYLFVPGFPLRRYSLSVHCHDQGVAAVDLPGHGVLTFGLLLRLEELEKAQRDLVPVDVDDGMIFSNLVKQI